MAITIAISWRTELQQTAWAVGYCPSCGCWDAIRVGEAVQVMSLYEWFPFLRTVIGPSSVCDWCEYPAAPAPDTPIIPLGDWSYPQGLGTLVAKCAPDLQPSAPQRTTDVEVQTLLEWIRRKSSINAVDLGAGLAVGLLAGAVVAMLIGHLIVRQQGDDPIRISVVSLALGGVGGVLLGAVTEAVLKSRRIARRMTLAAYQKYQLAADQLAGLARSYPARIRSAIKSVLAQTSP